MAARAMMTFDEWFARLSGGHAPHPWQGALAGDAVARSGLIRVPTGMGKTLGVLAAWTWHRIHRCDPYWPRRLVWCLPMRVLVEQTEATVRAALTRLGLLWDGTSPRSGRAGVHVLMGGSAREEWNLFPEEHAVLIGTQDMLLSRALNRGYGAGRARWPSEFGLLQQDALWVMDEVQLMDVGLATSAQLQAFLDDDAPKAVRPRITWWMSATLQPWWLRSVDTEPHYQAWVRDPTSIPDIERQGGLLGVRKALFFEEIPVDDRGGLAARVLEEHAAQPDGPHGRITMVVCNTVDRACATFAEICARAGGQDVRLVHSRFRPAERSSWMDDFLSREACAPGVDRIIVATQVIEAGVDTSCGRLITELAPWASLVQRFGRCARYGGTGRVVVVDHGAGERAALPYTADELAAARGALAALAASGGDAGVASLESLERALSEEDRRRLYAYTPSQLLWRREFDELFDTTPDLTGADLDVSRFIRSGDERDLHVFWLDLPVPGGAGSGQRSPFPPRAYEPRRDELCAVPFLAARRWLCGERAGAGAGRTRLRAGMRAWVWDWLDGDWVVADERSLTPGRTVCVASDCGGYSIGRGFDPTSTDPVPSASGSAVSLPAHPQVLADGSEGSDGFSAAAWQTIAFHSREVADELNAIAHSLKLPARLGELLDVVAWCHDIGKAHPAFQGAIRGEGRPARPDLAKAPEAMWLKPPGNYQTADGSDRRAGLRHELASALALFSILRRHASTHAALLGPWTDTLRLLGHVVPPDPEPTTSSPVVASVLELNADEFDLVAYLIASHHGKVRVSLHATPRDQEYGDPGDGQGLPIRGIREGDVLPSISLRAAEEPIPELTLTLEPATLGLSPATGRSWRQRTLDLQRRFGPAALAWLEALVVAADRRASRRNSCDPQLGREGERA